MKIAIEAGTVSPGRIATALTIIAGVLTIVSWYQPWFTLHFTTGNLVESPYALAQDPSGRAAWLVLGVGIALTVLGGIMIGWRKPLLAAVQTAITVGLLFAIYPLLGEMAVFAGQSSQGVTLLPEWGIYLIALSFALSLAGSILLWRQVRSAHE